MITVLASKNYLTDKQDLGISITEVPYVAESFSKNEIRLYLTQEQADELAHKIQEKLKEIE